MKKYRTYAFIFSQNTCWLAAILLLGTALRFYHLGQDSLWLDEAGVAYAARAATIQEMLQVVRSHVLAMPLDYLVVWLFGRIGLHEAVLRIPSAVWGSASLVLAYCFYRKFTNPIPALFGLLVLALSPFHIQYSQELRFYASLVFFYLLSSFLLWRAIHQPSHQIWTLSTAATIIGIYFHPYVIFALANGLVWLALSPLRGQPARALRVRFLMNATLGLVAFLGGYLVFSASNTFQIPLMVFEESPVSAIAAGLGWLPFYAGAPGPSWIWGILCALLEIGGVAVALLRQPRSPLAGLFYGFVLQFAAILGADLLGHYFFAPRQLIMLLPTLCLFAGLGAQAVISLIVRWIQPALNTFHPAHFQWIATSLAVLGLLLASLPAIQAYQQDDKGNSRVISQQILQEWQPGDTILITPGYEGFVFKYYIEYESGRLDAAKRLFIVDWQDLQKTNSWPGNLFVITPYFLTEDETNQMLSLGLSPRYHSFLASRYARTLWTRGKSQP
jgi:uncharacterized membrane protein